MIKQHLQDLFRHAASTPLAQLAELPSEATSISFLTWLADRQGALSICKQQMSCLEHRATGREEAAASPADRRAVTELGTRLVAAREGLGEHLLLNSRMHTLELAVNK